MDIASWIVAIVGGLILWVGIPVFIAVVSWSDGTGWFTERKDRGQGE